ncbi:MAG: PmoA family protein [Gemmataceae bacterium]
MRPFRWIVAIALFAPSAARAADVAVEKGKDTVDFKIDGKAVAKYQFAGTVQEEKSDARKPLAKPFLWPVLAPNGVPVTRAWPMDRSGKEKTDHFHQKSVWFCHGDVIPEGIDLKGKHAVDFWSETPGHGRIVCTVLNAANNRISSTNEWQTADGVRILDEERTISLREVAGGRMFVFECKLAANTCNITFGDTKEGSFGVRVHDGWRLELPTGGTVASSDGTSSTAPAKENLKMWGRFADWHDYSGTADGKTAGIAVFDHPSNPSRAAWHTRAYGLMAANPFGRAKSGFPALKDKTELVRLEKGKTLTFKYAVFVHDGDAKAGKVAEAYEAFKK